LTRGSHPDCRAILWRFLAALIAAENGVKELWSFANEKPAERGLLLDALQEEADRRDITLVRTARRKKRPEAAS